ncbi:MAG TPA: 3-methyladenine DNA glycosylase 2 [Aromatoleum sp.]|uniref:DNA-3-methyladenine glycosylase family protein n=1 Tax=Aromatoleum sp. TaxID=2307007 RepID=UPI002B498F79|nr:3-methyladenine DNA glycosylase 2 [Aromatoleum sp.]HJV24690.1 3-methyladenine DNA glycosylase 2 [Aromatoleum sp.]
MSARFSCILLLPAGFRPRDILAFHKRDAQEVAERVGADRLEKGMLWDGRPACLCIHFGAAQATAELAIDGDAAAAGEERFETMVRRMLGLGQGVEDFEARYRDHPGLGPVLARQAGLRVPVTATPFEALTWAITGQQISVRAAVSLRRKLILATGVRHSGGLMCYPEPGRVGALAEDELRGAGFSAAKARTLLTVSQLAAEDRLPLEAWCQTLPVVLPVDEIRDRLLEVRGIGPWTVNYMLLRGFGWLDGSLHGDVAVRRGIQTLLASPDRIGENLAKEWLAEFSPWRALVAAHLWAAQSSTAY